MKIVKRTQTFRPQCQSSWLAWPVNWSRTTLTDIAIEKSFRIIYDSSTARGCRRFPIALFRLTTRIRDSMRNQPPPRKTIRMNVPNYLPALALVPRCLMQAHRFTKPPHIFLARPGHPRVSRKIAAKILWAMTTLRRVSGMTSVRRPETLSVLPEPLHQRNYQSYGLRDDRRFGDKLVERNCNRTNPT